MDDNHGVPIYMRHIRNKKLDIAAQNYFTSRRTELERLMKIIVEEQHRLAAVKTKIRCVEYSIANFKPDGSNN